MRAPIGTWASTWRSTAAGGSLPPGIGGTLVGGAAFFLIGVALYLTTGGALGALVGRQEEAAAAVALLSVMLIAFSIVGQGGAETTLGGILAYVPFAAPMVMPGRIALGASSAFEIAASLTIGVATVLVVDGSLLSCTGAPSCVPATASNCATRSDPCRAEPAPERDRHDDLAQALRES